MSLLFSYLFLISFLPTSIERIALEDDTSTNEEFVTGIVYIDAIGPNALSHLKDDFSISWWVENNKEILVHARRESFNEITKEYQCVLLKKNILYKNLAFAKLGTNDDQNGAISVLTKAGAFAVIELDPNLLDRLTNDSGASHSHSKTKIWPFKPNSVLVKLSSNRRIFRKTSTRSFQDLVDNVNGTRWFSDIQTLASFNRYTHNPENLDARDWLVTQFEELPGLTVTTEAFTVGITTTYNVMAVLPGTTRPDDWYIVGGHFDSTSQSTSTSAPGAEDNASGTAGVLEMARIFSAQPPDATVIFICFSGEEQGLHGSAFHVTQLQSSGNQAKVQGVITMDMIGYTADPELDCLLETRAFANDLSQVLERAAADYTSLVISTTNNASGSDHVPYLNASIPAILTIENDWNIYPDYHKTTDLPANISIAMGEETLKMNVAGLAEMAFSRASLAYGETIILNPGTNGVADPGETLQLNFSLTNSGQLGASSVSCVLTSSSPFVSILQGNSNYSIIQEASSGTNLTPFELILDPSLPCGDSVLLNLEVSYNDGQNRTIQLEVSLTTGTVMGAEVSATPDLAIPDNSPAGISSPIIMTGTGGQVSGNFNIDMNITHTYIGDLTIDLESPNHTIVRLWNKTGGGTNDLIGNFPQSLNPAGNLADFAGEPLDGTWVLHIVDSGPNDLGSLNAWGINDIQGYDCEPTECNLNLTLDSLGGVSPLIPCAGDLFSIESTLSGNSGSETFSWAITEGNAIFEGSTNQQTVTVRSFSNAQISCTVSDSGCEANSSFSLGVLKTSVFGDEHIREEDLHFLIDTYWKTQHYDLELDFNTDSRIDILDLIDYAQCL